MNLITRDELRQKFERGDEFELVMTLSALAYCAKRIPGSRHFETIGEALAVLDPAQEIIVYCSDVYCAASIYAYRLLEREGYARVRRYAGGLADWEAAGYPIDTGPSSRTSDRPVGREPRREVTVGRQAPAWANRPWRVCV